MQASGNETLQQVASSFNLREDDVLSDNQGVVSGPRDSLEGRSILLCSRNGESFTVPTPGQHDTAAGAGCKGDHPPTN